MPNRIFALLLVLATATFAAPAVADAANPCANPTIRVRTSGVVYGTNGHDVIQGSAGADVIHGLGGNDVICGGDGADVLLGDGGTDRLHGGIDGDSLDGGAGALDRCDGGSGADSARRSTCEIFRNVP